MWQSRSETDKLHNNDVQFSFQTTKIDASTAARMPKRIEHVMRIILGIYTAGQG